MNVQMQQVGPGVVGAYDFTDADTVADVGGGHGVLLATILSVLRTCRACIRPGARLLLIQNRCCSNGRNRLL